MDPRAPHRPTPPSDAAAPPSAPPPGGPPLAPRVDAAIVDRVWTEHHRRMRVARVVPWLALPAVAGVALWGTLAPWRNPQRAVDRLAPGVRLGERVAPAVLRRYAFRIASNLGYAAPAHPAPGAPPHLRLVIRGGAPTDPFVSAPGEVASVLVSTMSRPEGAALERELRELYGRPRVRCSRDGFRAVTWRSVYGGTSLVVHETGGQYSATVQLGPKHADGAPRGSHRCE